jgi:hypothetical protein
MPFISQAYLQYLEEQFGAASGQGQIGDVDIPPANPSATPTTAPDLGPALGGPTGPAAGAPGTVPQWPPGNAISLTPPSDPVPPPAQQPAGIAANPWAPPPPPQVGNVPGANEPLLPAAPGAPPSGGGTPSGGQGDRQDDSGKVAGVDLSPTDRINMILHSLGLPSVPTGYDPFSGLPPGFSEGNRFGGGAPTFTPPNFSGPNWSPGGSIFGGTLAPGGWVAGGGNIGNLGSGGTMANVSALGGYNAQGWKHIGQPTRALVGGPPPNVWSPWMLANYPMSQAGVGTPKGIVNPAAFGAPTSTQHSIHFRPKATD